MTDEGTELVHERHFTREEANALLPQLTALLTQLREARDELTDVEAHEALSELHRMAGSQFCPRCVGALEAIVATEIGHDPAPVAREPQLVD